MKNVIVIGAGASGLTAAIHAAKFGANVTILEHMDKAGKKILITGNGRCNLMNNYIDDNSYSSANNGFAQRILNEYSQKDVLDFFEDLGLFVKIRDEHYYYPYSDQAGTVLSLLLAKACALKVKIKYCQEIVSIEKSGDTFLIKTPTYEYACDSLILATGSKAAPMTGSTGKGYDYAKDFGHKIIKPLPALVPLICDNKEFLKLAKGVRAESILTLYIDEQLSEESFGELQITNYGISGIITFQISNRAVKAIDERKKVTVIADFLPNETADDIINRLIKARNSNPTKDLIKLLTGYLNDNLAKALITELRLNNNDCSDETIRIIVEKIKAYKFNVSGYCDFDKAQVCQGGVDTRYVSCKTLESKIIKDLYIVGELLDVDGKCGGYNLLFAFSTGALAGINAAKQ